MNKKIKVSVVMITYNHEQFIKEAINGVLKQVCDFKVELIISNDKSSDKTHSVITKYLDSLEKSIFFTICYFNHKENKGVLKNFQWSLAETNGEYVAICEGDDYWTDPLKLQKQVDFLEENPGFELCFTNCKTVDKNRNTIKPKFLNYQKSVYTKENLLFIAPTSTRVFKNRNFKELDFKNIVAADSYLLIWQLQKGKAKYLPEITGAYRKHVGGVWTSANKINKAVYHFEIFLESFDIIDKDLYERFYRLATAALLSIAVLDKDEYAKNLKKFKSVYERHDLSSLYAKRLWFCLSLIHYSNKKNRDLMKKVILKLI